ncbi:TAXI family TRAP transporter solute-binding subunit [Asanoa siamensis]|uniref:C4-dicarboxylate ABC transporter substrate-binding protein n=1 Tax=Asanoa siamensis TaxID=926357 RepID=A0ABQ4CI83_9ACTN|nr:TAXI family TRAP transporter solute-binding subunit [Asanoa siamensis]GIF70985.1 C4-dicarboxylate ABC transporter substrate-binding protein [Asanoa siamensis]
MTARRAGSALLVLLLVAAGVYGEGNPPVSHIRIATGSPTAVYYAFGRALGQLIDDNLPDTEAEVLVTAASAENVQLVENKEAEIGFTQADILVTGTAPPDPRVRALARVYEDLLHLVVPSDSPIRNLKDLRGKTVATGAPGSGTEITVGRLLDVADLGKDEPDAIQARKWGLDQSAEALKDGHIDAFFFSGGLPVQAIEDLDDTLGIRIVDLGEWVVPMREAYSTVYVQREVNDSVYDLPAVSTLAVPNFLVVPTDMPDPVAYDLTRLLMEQHAALARAHPAGERFDVRSAIGTMPVPLHPGAARYFRSVKP